MPRGKVKTIVMLDNNNTVLKEFKNGEIASKETGIPKPTIWSQCTRKSRGKRDCYFLFKKDYLQFKANEKPILKSKKKEYYVNVWVGLANGTLENGATYTINGLKLQYNKQKEALMSDNKIIFTKNDMFKEVEVELPILLEEERNFLRTLLKAFTNVNGIRKCKDRRNGFEFIRIETNNDEETVALPSFIEGTYYKALQLDRLYTVKELEI